MVLEHGETIDSGDQTIVEDAYDSAYALLDELNLVSWGSGDDIPTRAELPVIDYVSYRVMGAFQVPPDVRQLLPLEAINAENLLAAMVMPAYTSDTIEADYF